MTATETSKGPFALLAYFFRSYPVQSMAVIGALLLAGFAETLGIGALLPLLNTILGEGQASEDNVLQQLIDRLFAFFSVVPTLEVLLSTIVTMVVLKAVIVFFAMRHAGFIAADIARDFQLRLIHSLMHAQWPYFSSLSLGMVSNAVASESQRAGHSYMLAGKTLASLMQSLIYLAAAFLVLWKLSVLAIVLGGVLAFLVKGIIRMARTSGADLSRTMDVLLSRLNDSLAGAKPLKAMAQEDRFCEQLEKETALVVKARKQQYVSALLMQVIYEPALVVCLACGLYYVLTFSQVPVAEVLLLAFLFHRLMGYISLTQSHYQNMVQNENAVWSLEQQIKNAQKDAETLREGKQVELQQKISIEGITVAYSNGVPVLENYSAEIPAGKLTVLFGPSGVGKTTLIDSVLGLLPLSDGKILADGQALSDLDMLYWRRHTGYVPQESFLFHDTIRNNITLGEDGFSDDDIFAALKKAAAYDFVMEMPEQMETVVGERGGRLSGGQRQRIALARALVRRPRMLVLDEPTSALDKDNEASILETIKTLSGEITVVLISHDEKVLDIADHVLRFEKK